MKIKILSIILIPSILLSNSYKFYQIEYKDNRKEIVKIVNMTDTHTYIFKNNIIEKIDNILINKHTLINKNDQRFKRVILLTEKNYIRGYIVYQDRDKLSISLSMDDPKLLTFKFNNIVDIVNADTFDYEMSKTKWKALKYSFMFPGLGQFYTSDRNFSGIFFMSSFILSSSASYYSYKQSQSYYNQYKQSRYKETKYYHRYKTYTYASWGLAGLSSCLFLLNLLDSYYNFRYKYNVKSEYNVISENQEIPNEKNTVFNISYSFMF